MLSLLYYASDIAIISNVFFMVPRNSRTFLNILVKLLTLMQNTEREFSTLNSKSSKKWWLYDLISVIVEVYICSGPLLSLLKISKAKGWKTLLSKLPEPEPGV